MGRLIEVERVLEPYKILRNTDTLCVATIRQNILECPTVEAIPKDQYEQRLKENNELINDLEELRTMINKLAESYENRLKADMVAMLTELKIEIEKMKMQSLTEKEIWNNAIGVCSGLIQQKIDKLKEVEL